MSCMSQIPESRDEVNLDMKTCMVCYVTTDGIDGIKVSTLSKCGHQVCYDCFRNNIRQKFRTNGLLTCPDPICKVEVTAYETRWVLTESEMDLYQRNRRQYRKASKVAMRRFRELIKDPQMRKIICTLVMPCPTCFTLVEKIDGCDTIICVCSTKFCYRCGNKMGGDSHRCSPCRCGSFGHHPMICPNINICHICKTSYASDRKCNCVINIKDLYKSKYNNKKQIRHDQVANMDVICKICQQRGHKSRACRAILCSKCMVWNDHLMEDCPMYCDLCEEEGHYRETCALNYPEAVALVKELVGVSIRTADDDFDNFDMLDLIGGSNAGDGENNKDVKKDEQLDESLWRCKGCSFINDKNHAACMACYTPEYEKSWDCTFCKTRNPDDISKCNTCKETRIVVQVGTKNFNSLTPKNGFWFSRHLPCALDGQAWEAASKNNSSCPSERRAWDLVSDCGASSVTADNSDWDIISVNSATTNDDRKEKIQEWETDSEKWETDSNMSLV